MENVDLVELKEAIFESEFDLLSQESFEKHGIYRSIQGIPFEYWLPLPLSRRHSSWVRADVGPSLNRLALGGNLT